MNARHFRFGYNFHPVGQGLFASGYINPFGKTTPCFQWVYDCGTSSSQKLIDSSISWLVTNSPNAKKSIDLVTLSHFDHDHISGICRLARNFEINYLMLPYMPLEQRLWVALEENISIDDPLIGFFVNPVEYLGSLSVNDNAGIKNILYVQPSGDSRAPGGETLPPQDNVDSWRVEMDLDTRIIDSSPAGRPNVNVEFLRRGGGIRLSSFWEFIPYNDDLEQTVPNDFKKSVQTEVNNLIGKTTIASNRSQALINLKALYDNQFGNNSVNRNIISLFLFAGPINTRKNEVAYLDFYQDSWLNVHVRSTSFQRYYSIDANAKTSILYTGDGYLDNHNRILRLIDFLGNSRVSTVGVMQVMHHGAEANWHKGVGEVFKPICSIFCSDPQRKKWGHPHSAVLRDFWIYNPLQVDKHQNAFIEGQIYMN